MTERGDPTIEVLLREDARRYLHIYYYILRNNVDLKKKKNVNCFPDGGADDGKGFRTNTNILYT